jgi:hypothetical protein
VPPRGEIVHRCAAQCRCHAFAYHDPEASLLAVSDGAGGVWFRERGGEWWLGGNGEQGLYFMTEREGSPWVPELTTTPDAIDWYLERFCFANDLLSRDESRTAFTVWIFQHFFPKLRRTGIIPTFLGQQGAGKTTGERLVGRLFLGPSFDVTGIQRDREDAFVAAVTCRNSSSESWRTRSSSRESRRSAAQSRVR